MFVAGLEVDLRVFHAKRHRSLVFGALTFALPMLAGILVGRLFDFGWNASFLIGSLIASHTLLGYPIVARMGLVRSESVTITLGATIFTDTAALLVLAVCVSVHTGGFSPMGLAVQILQLTLYSLIVLIGIPFLGARFLRRFRHDELALFSFVLLAVLLAAMGATLIHLEDIVGAFFAGLAVNRVVARTTVLEKLHFLGKLKQFLEKGWQFGGQIAATAKAGEKGGAAGGIEVSDGITVYQLTQSGLMAAGGLQGSKYWRYEGLN